MYSTLTPDRVDKSTTAKRWNILTVKSGVAMLLEKKIEVEV